MKTLNSLAVATLVALAATACGRKDTNPSDTTTTSGTVNGTENDTAGTTNTTGATTPNDTSVTPSPQPAPAPGETQKNLDRDENAAGTEHGATDMQKGKTGTSGVTDESNRGSSIQRDTKGSSSTGSSTTGSSHDAKSGAAGGAGNTSTTLGDGTSGQYTGGKGTYGGKATHGTGPGTDLKKDGGH
jgi:hypothetical protein